MKLKNNSNNEWLNYNCGDEVFIDIKPNSTFIVDDKSGAYILRLLGHPNWITQVEENNFINLADPIETIEQRKSKVFCEVCLSKSYRHKKGCSEVSKT
jgi:hypothetical protein